MITALLTAILSLSALSENFSQKQLAKFKIKKDLTYEDLAHENPGCPENSICSEEMGKKMIKWNEFAKKLKEKKRPGKALDEFRRKNGLPVSFLATKDSALSLDPILYTSRCEHHNPKDANKTVYKGIQFFRNNPQSKSALFDSVIVYDGSSRRRYQVPYEDAPLMIKDQNVVVVQEYDELFYHLAISADGKWKALNLSPQDISKARQTLENAQCPDEESGQKIDIGANHLKNYCKKIWNKDLKKEQLIRLVWSCP
ncbi:MAG: hypothetical protein WEB87_07270 [Bacteriovoracaceae bacterium]